MSALTISLYPPCAAISKGVPDRLAAFTSAPAAISFRVSATLRRERAQVIELRNGVKSAPA